MNTETKAAEVVCSSAELGLVDRLKSLKSLLGTDSPEVRGWAPVVQQTAQATVNAAISALNQCGGDNCMGQRVPGVTQWVTEEAAAARVAAERERIDRLLQEHLHVSLATLEYLQAMREGPTPEEWAEMDANARTQPSLYDETDVMPKEGDQR